MINDSLGDRIKQYEGAETARRFMPLLPICARIDGRSFSKFTKGMKRPYDENMSMCMIETAKYLVKETHATIGYTQSDEISLVWKNNSIDSEMLFNGKVFKFTSLLSALATVKFNAVARIYFPIKTESSLPTFDARVFQVPTLVEASNVILWRVNDAVKNSISMAASAYYPHSKLMNKNSNDKHDLLYDMGINWNDYPQFFKEGTFVKRVSRAVQPSANAIHYNVTEVVRSYIDEMTWPPFKSIDNKIDVLFNNADPILKPQICI